MHEAREVVLVTCALETGRNAHITMRGNMSQSYHKDSNFASNNLPMSQAESHIFNTIFATYYGVHEAILIAHFQHWVNYNKRLGQNFKDGRTWTYQTRKEIAAWFPYFTEKQVRAITNSLEKQGVLIKGNYNKKGFDKTIWYAFENEEIFTIAHLGKGAAQMGNPSAQMGKPIPDTKTYTKPDTKEHICPTGGNASSLDDLGHAEFIPVLRGKAKQEYEGLAIEQKDAFKFLMNVPPAHNDDQRFNPVTALNIVRCKTKHEIRKAIMVYKQRLERGEHPKSMGSYLKDIIEKGYEPVPVHAGLNKDTWEKKKGSFPPGCYQESRDGVLFTRLDKDVSWRMSPEIFNEQLNRIRQQLKEL